MIDMIRCRCDNIIFWVVFRLFFLCRLCVSLIFFLWDSMGRWFIVEIYVLILFRLLEKFSVSVLDLVGMSVVCVDVVFMDFFWFFCGNSMKW